jgi:putative phage-type endonuclease
MPAIELIQGSQKWLSYRQGKVMATCTPVILGSNPFKTKLELWEEKLNIRPSPQLNDAMKRGTELEPTARQIVEEMLGEEFPDCVYESEEHTWMAASLDGVSEDARAIIELKCPTNPKLHFNNKEGIIPEYYLDQMQHQLICMPKIEVNYFCTYYPEDKECPVKITKVFCNFSKQAEIIEKGYEFYMQMCNFEAPVEWKLNKKG